MIFFRSDYSQGGHPRIMDALVNTNLVHVDGYGEDDFCNEAAATIKAVIGKEDADVHFMVGGTSTNLTSIAAFIRPYESVIAVDSSHICKHETGAIEATGHKINYMHSDDGKLYPEMIQTVLDQWEDEHMVVPRLIYISQPTELGSLYSKQDMLDLRAKCDEKGLHFYVDGARLGSALTSAQSDFDIKDIAQIADAFYIGGTKNGALFGEALVIVKDELKTNYRFFMKQRGGLLAKGKLLGVQFQELFKDGLYLEIAKHTNEMAAKLKAGIEEMGFGFLVESPTNQIFPIMPNDLIEKLEEDFFFYVWQPVDENTSAIRLVTSWGTTEDEVDAFLEALKN